MTTNVSFELAKLLIQKGYDLHPDFKDSYPTIAEVVMWLYEKDKIWITSEPFIKSDDIVVYIYKIFKNGYVDTISRASTGFNSIDQSYEAGIEYVLKNLI